MAGYRVGTPSIAPPKPPEEVQASTPGMEQAVVEPAYQPSRPSAAEGTHPLAISPEEGLFAVPTERVLLQLQKLLKLKYGSMIMYANYGARIRAHFRDAIYDHFNEHLKDERKDAYLIVMKITALGGSPKTAVAIPQDVGALHEIFMSIIQAEKDLIGEGRALAAMAGENLGLKVLAENIVLNDQLHADDARRMFSCEN